MSAASLRLAFLGPSGTFTESAALRYAPGAELIAAPSISSVTASVTEGRADEAIVPIENSLQGSVTETLDLLLHSIELKIRAEIVLAVEHCLIVQRGTTRDAIRSVYSHPQALAQCRGYIERELPEAEVVATLSTAQAVQRVVEAGAAAAIAPRRAAEIHGAEVMEAGIQDEAQNSTRFVVLAAEDAAPTGDDKTSIAFNVADKPGALVGIMQRFADAGINLTKIESRPARETMGVYIFLLDGTGHRLDPAVAAVLDAVAADSAWLKVFGSYPRFHEG